MSITRGGYSVNIAMECARGLAALWVFLFHIPDMVKTSLPQLHALALQGYLGVPVFFAVSGYCIFAAAQRCIGQQSGSREFLKRRLVRIFPTFWASILVILVLPYVLEGLSALKTGTLAWPRPAWTEYALLDWIAVVSLTKDLLDGVRGGPGYTLINSVYWTLAIEVQFYLVLYVAISFHRLWLAVLGAVSILGFIAMTGWLFKWEGFFLQFWPAFLCGVALRLAYSTGFHPRSVFGKHEFLGSIGAMMALLFILALFTQSGHKFSFMETAAAAACALWVLGGVENGSMARTERIPKFRELASALLVPLILLGQCSYSLYLLHGKLYQLPAMFVRQLLPVAHPLHLPAVVFGTILLCYCFYYFVERRYQRSAGKAPVQVEAPSLLPDASMR
jgi:peptidoglycan/LPS O-acetylase OafA/YrhL